MTLNKEILWADFETYSEIDIKKSGGYKYCHHESTNIICLGFALNDEPTQLWTPAKTMPQRILNAVEKGAEFRAVNGVFDFRIWNKFGVEDFNWPGIDINNLLDVSALTASFSLPLSLEGSSQAMGVKLSKLKEGKALINKLCKPNKKGEQPMPYMPDYKLDFLNFFEYCKRDVDSMRELVSLLPRDHLIPKEKKIWHLTYNFNNIGLPVAFDEAKIIKETIDKYCESKLPELIALTGGLVTSINQHKKIKDFCSNNGYPMTDTQAGTITEALDDPNCKGPVRKLLELRNEIGSAATAKYNALMRLAVKKEDGTYWLLDNLIYHGAGPGRWTGRGFQMHNLPRAKVKRPQEIINQFLDGTFTGNPVRTGKALIRPMIKAPKGFKIMVADYTSIENKILHWLAMDHETIKDFNSGIDQYIRMAAARYDSTYEEIKAGCSIEDPVAKGMRQMGKVIILGCGYMMGWETFIVTARQQFGMIIEDDEGKAAITAYRNKYVLVVRLWHELKSAAAKAVLTGKRQTYGLITFGTSTVKGTRWLAMRLPSGKSIYYKNPKIEQKYIPRYESMGRVPTITHEGKNPYSKKWQRLALTPGRLTENAVQGFAREIMAQGMLNVAERMPYIKQIGTVHDEDISLVPDEYATEETLKEFCVTLCDIPFAIGCPIGAEGYIEERYKKD